MNSIQKEQNQDKIDFLNLFGIDVFKLESTHIYPDNELYKYSIICHSKDLLQDFVENFEDKTNKMSKAEEILTKHYLLADNKEYTKQTILKAMEEYLQIEMDELKAEVERLNNLLISSNRFNQKNK